MVRIGVVGTGFGRAVHIPGFQAVAGAAVIGVASGYYAHARETAGAFSLPRYFDVWHDLVTCEEIDAVAIATPPVLHEEIALAALDAGKAVLCEKPMAMDAGQAGRMLDAARKTGAVHAVDFEFRELPAWRLTKHILDSGELGDLRHVHITWVVQSWSDPARPWSWRSVRAQGGGTLGALGAHAFDYVEWFLGPVRSLVADLRTRIPGRPDAAGVQRPVDSEDCCHLLLELADGTPVSLTISAIAPVGRGHILEFYGTHKTLVLRNENVKDYGEGFEVLEGPRGGSELSLRPVPDELYFERTFEDGRLAPFVSLAQRFVDAVSTGRQDMRPSFEDGFRARLLMDLAFHSCGERRWFDVPDAGVQIRG